MKSDPKIDNWIRCLEIIEKEIYELLMLRYVFWELQNIIKTNPKIQTDGYFYEWLGITYSKTTSIGVRRQLDTRSDVITLGRLLSEIQRTPTILSLKRFENFYTKDLRNQTEEDRMFYNFEKKRAEKEFKKFSGKLKTHVDPDCVSQDLTLLSKACKPILKYVNKRVAHRDKKEFTTLPTYNDLNKAIDLLLDVYKKYVLLLRGVQYFIEVTPLWDWKEVFKVAWIEKY